jgi:hypothetical protein
VLSDSFTDLIYTAAAQLVKHFLKSFCINRIARHHRNASGYQSRAGFQAPATFRAVCPTLKPTLKKLTVWRNWGNLLKNLLQEIPCRADGSE